jgi:TP901 family phage tail tape measure protein
VANMWTLLVRLQADSRQMEYALSSVERKMGGFAGKLGGMGRNMSATGRAMTIGVTGPILATGAAVVNAAADWETSFTSIRKVLSDEDMANAHITFEQLERSLRDMAKVLPVEGGVNALAQVAAQGGALGIGAENIVEFTEVVTKLNQTADDVTMEAAAKALGHLNTSMVFSKGEMIALADAVVQLGNNGASTEGEILGMTSAISGAAAIAKIGSEETVAWAASMSNVGEKAQAGGSSLSRYFSNMSDFITQGTDELETIADVLGITEEAVQKAFGEDSNQLLVDFLDSLSKMDPAKWTGVLSELGLGDLLRRRGFTKMLNALRENAPGSLVNMMEELANAQGAMDIEFQKRVDTLNAKLQLIGQRLYEAAITAGETLIPIIEEHFLPVLDEVIEKLQEVAEWFSKLPDDTKKTVVQIALMVAAAGPLLFIFGGVFQFIGLIIGSIMKLKDLLGGVLGMFGGLGRLAPGGGQGPLARLTAQPVFVTNWPPGMMTPGGGGPGGMVPTAARGFWGSFAAGAARVFGIAAAGFIGFELGKLIGNQLIEPTVKPARDYETGRFEDVLASNNAERIANGIDVIKAQLNPDYWDLPGQAALLLDAGGMRTTLEQQLAQLEAALPAAEATADNTGESAKDVREFYNQSNRHAEQLEALTRDLATAEVIEHLGRTTEMGLKGVGTSMQEGFMSGLDPVGDTATKILARAENPLDPPVMTEIRGHIAGLEEIQQTYLERGDIKLAEKVQANIDTLYALIDEVDVSNAINELHRQQAVANAATALGVAQSHIVATNANGTKIDLDRQAVNALNLNEGARFASLNGQVYSVKAAVDGMHLTLMNKNFNPVIYNNNIVTAPSGAPITYAPGGGKQIGAPGRQHGAWNLSEDELAFLHAGEMVVPKKQADTWRRGLMSAGGAGGTSGRGGDEIYQVKVDGLMQVARPSDLIRPMKHLARGKRYVQPNYGFHKT